jgi:hypothetical protein
MKTFAGAREMYELDSRKMLWREAACRLDSEVATMLVSGGYLQTMPECQAVSEISQPKTSYVALPTGVLCLTHGRIGGSGTAREQLQAAGVSDPALLEAASRRPPLWDGPNYKGWSLAAYLLLELLGAMGGAFWPNRRTVLWSGRLLFLLTVWTALSRYSRPGEYTVSVLLALVPVAAAVWLVMTPSCLTLGRNLRSLLSPSLEAKS